MSTQQNHLDQSIRLLIPKVASPTDGSLSSPSTQELAFLVACKVMGLLLQPQSGSAPLDITQYSGQLDVGIFQIHVDRLTHRKREVLACLSLGMSNNSIGEMLCISPNTVRGHISAIRNEFSVLEAIGGLDSLAMFLLKQDNRTSLASFVMSQGFRPDKVIDVNSIPIRHSY